MQFQITPSKPGFYDFFNLKHVCCIHEMSLIYLIVFCISNDPAVYLIHSKTASAYPVTMFFFYKRFLSQAD